MVFHAEHGLQMVCYTLPISYRFLFIKPVTCSIQPFSCWLCYHVISPYHVTSHDIIPDSVISRVMWYDITISCTQIFDPWLLTNRYIVLILTLTDILQRLMGHDELFREWGSPLWSLSLRNLGGHHALAWWQVRVREGVQWIPRVCHCVPCPQQAQSKWQRACRPTRLWKLQTCGQQVALHLHKGQYCVTLCTSCSGQSQPQVLIDFLLPRDLSEKVPFSLQTFFCNQWYLGRSEGSEGNFCNCYRRGLFWNFPFNKMGYMCLIVSLTPYDYWDISSCVILLLRKQHTVLLSF